MLTCPRCSGTAAHECVSEDALVHLKSYKYSSVDKSLISKYILKHYVREPFHIISREITNSASTVERLRRTLAIMARSKYGDPPRILLHPWQRHNIGNIYPRPCWTSMCSFLSRVKSRLRKVRILNVCKGPSWVYYSFAFGVWM